MSLKDLKRRSTEELIAAALAADKKRDRSRKTPTKEEKEKILLLKMLDYKEEPVQVLQEERVKPENASDNEWDVKIGDPIEYFDPTLSYELTGYRPITKDRGLDFDPKLFTVAADYYRKFGKYTDLIPGTFAHRQHWMEEFRRCRDGCTIGKYTITGKNYFWLNYYRLLSVLNNDDGTQRRKEDFPGFFTKQYEFFHYKEICKKLGKDINSFKSRGVGFSEMSASDVSCDYTVFPNSYSIITAFSEGYVTQTLSKVWQELDFLNTCTEGAFRHVRMKIDTAFKKKASKVDQDKNESGWGSIIEGIVHDNPRKLRGARVDNLIFEECGSDKLLLDTYILSQPLVDILGKRVGVRTTGGTGGDASSALSGLKSIFYNPEAYDVLPYKNKYGRSGDVQYTGFFIPAYSLWFGKYDSRGVVDEDAAKEFYNAMFEKTKDPKDVIRKKAEYCFTPEDAFILEGSNNFDQEKLVDQKAAIEIHKTVPLPLKMKLHWQLTDGIPDINKMPTVEVGSGNILFSELPMTDESGIAFKNLYVIAADAIDSDAQTSTGQTDVSKFAIVVFRRLVGLLPPKPVAIYKERPLRIKDAWETTLKLAMFYNAKVLVEATRVSVIHYFIEKKKENYLMKRPQATANSSGRTNFKLYGVPAPEHVIMHQLDLIAEYISDYCEQILFLDLLDELISYSYENKRKFDLVAAFGIALLADEELIGKSVRTNSEYSKNKIKLGYSRNEYGQVQFGEIKQENEHKLRKGNIGFYRSYL